MVPDNILLKIKEDIVNSCRLAGCVINRSRVIAIRKGTIRATDASLLKECGCLRGLTNCWARILMEKMNWSQRKVTTSKLPVAPVLDCEIKRSFQKNCDCCWYLQDYKDLIFNFDQTPLAFISPGSYTMAPKGEKKVPIQNENSKGVLLEQLLLLLPVLLYPSS